MLHGAALGARQAGKGGDGVRESGRIVGAAEVTGFAGHHVLARAAVVGGNDGNAHGEGFEGGHAEAFAVGGEEAEIGAAENERNVVAVAVQGDHVCKLQRLNLLREVGFEKSVA